MASSNEATFTVDILGETTGEKYPGKFKTKVRLSHRDSIAADNFRRNLLGPNPETAGGRAASLAYIASELSVRILESPKWYEESDSGLSLEDENVLVILYNKCIELQKEAYDRLHKKAEEAVEDVKEKLEEKKQ